MSPISLDRIILDYLVILSSISILDIITITLFLKY